MRMSIQIMPIEGTDYMKNSMKVLLILLISLIIILISITVYNKVKIQNVFDEIYYDSRNASGDGFEKRSSLGNIKGMSSSPMDLTSINASEGERIIIESYQDKFLPSPMKSLIISNNSTKNQLEISYSLSVTENVNIFFENKYDVKTKALTKRISFIELDSGKRITTKKEVQKSVAKYNITDEQLKQWYNLGMNKIFLKDWFSVYPSKYSIGHLGNVKIQEFGD
ncbi:TipC family immunity protein [Erwinia sp. CPCC 100877]|nr:TipC family immunity protein [Erwinia sp. CPCC 100877]